MRLRVEALETARDWEAVRAPLQALEARAPRALWAGWSWWERLVRFFHPGERAWFLGLEGGTGLQAATVVLESLRRTRLGPLRRLRSLDALALRQPPWILDPEAQEEALQGAAALLPEIGRRSGAEFWSAYRVHGPEARPWIEALRRRRRSHRRRVFSLSQSLHLPEDLEAWRMGPSRKDRRDAERRLRRLREQGEVGFERCTADAKPAELRRAWGDFQELRRRTWQWRWAVESGRVDPVLLGEFYDEVFEEQIREGLAEILLLRLDGHAIAGGWNLRTGGGRLWMYLMGYDQAFRKAGPGSILFAWSVEDGHRRFGDRIVEFGAEALDWKRKWANREEELLELELPLRGWRGRLWALRNRLGPSPSAEPVRSARDNDY